MSFSHVQGNATFSAGNVTTRNVVLAAAPTLGNIVCIGLVFAGTISALVVQDSNSNTYTVTPNSPESNGTGGTTYLAYLLNAPSNASATITATWTTAVPAAIWGEEFSFTGASPFFDTDIGGLGTGTAVNTPSITPTYPNSLVFSVTGSGGTVTSPTAGGTQGVWTGSAGGVQNGNMGEYDLSVTGATAVNYVQNSTTWSAMAMAFGQLQSGVGYSQMPVFFQG